MYKYIVDELVNRHSKPHKKEKITTEYVKQKLFDNIHYKRVLDHLDLTELLTKLPKLLQERKNIKMVLIDSFPTQYKNLPDQKNTNKIIGETINEFVSLANKYNICVSLHFVAYIMLLIHCRNTNSLLENNLNPTLDALLRCPRS